MNDFSVAAASSRRVPRSTSTSSRRVPRICAVSSRRPGEVAAAGRRRYAFKVPAAGSRRYDWSGAAGRSARPNAFTLLELIISLAVSSVLLAGVGSSVFLALRASDVGLGSASRVRAAHEALLRIARDVEYALSVQSSPTTLTLTIPDITGDGKQETVVYTWETAADRPLLRTMNDGPAENILARVYAVEISSNIRTINTARIWTSLDVTLQMDKNPHTRVHMATSLLNRPEVPEA